MLRMSFFLFTFVKSLKSDKNEWFLIWLCKLHGILRS